MITATEAREFIKKTRGLYSEIMIALDKSGVNEIQGIMVHLAETNEKLAEENGILRAYAKELEGKVEELKENRSPEWKGDLIKPGDAAGDN